MATINGTAGNDVLQAAVGGDRLNGLAGNDVLIGNTGNDTLNGGTGDDNMIGGAGDDSYFVDSAGDVVTEDSAASGGTDIVSTSISYSLGTGVENLTSTGSGNIVLTGNGLANLITGNDGNNVLDGGVDSAANVVDVLTGGQGNDTYIIRDGADDQIVEIADNAVAGTTGGVDTAIVIASLGRTSYTLDAAAVVENLIASDAASTLGLNLTGNATAQTIVGNAGVNTLEGGGGADTLIGLGGNDIYNVSTTTTVVTEAAGDGSDIVNITGPGGATAALRDYSITGSVEQIAVTNAAGTLAINITGGTTSQSITGNAGANALIGGGGTDTLIGLAGDDTYTVDSLDDVVTDTAGTDRVIALSSYALGAASGIELFTAGGTDFSVATGQGDGTLNLNALNTTVTTNYFVGDNATSQQIWGDAGANILNGRIDGTIAGAADTLVGGNGSDTYRVYGQTDVVVEDANGGAFDIIYTSGNYSLVTNDTNAGAVVINDGTNSRRLDGVAVAAPAGTGLASTPYLTGAGQIEVLSAADQNLGTAGTASLVLTGNAYGQIIIGDFGDNAITDNGSGAAAVTGAQDQLAGLKGNDTYTVTAQNTTVNENVGEGTDVVNVTLGAGGFFTLIDAAEVEYLNASGGAAFNLRGNQYNQVITGNGAANTLDGNGGQDTLVGGAGSDVYVITAANAANVSIIEATAAAGDTDTVSTSVSFDLGATNVAYTSSTGAVAAAGTIGIEAIVVTNGQSTDNINLTGNGAAQILVGNYGNNILNGDNDTGTTVGGVFTPTGTAAGDTLTGLLGNDTYRVYSQNDVVRENGGEGTDVVFTSGNYQLRTGNSVETLSAATQSSTTGLVLTGNEFAQTIIGTAGNDTIWGGQGNDTLIGGAGSDTFGIGEVGAANADVLQDFTPGDFIGLSSTAFGNFGGTFDANEFVVGTAATQAFAQVIYNQSTGQLFFDADGTGAASTAVLFATLVPGTGLGFNDFALIGAAPTPIAGA